MSLAEPEICLSPVPSFTILHGPGSPPDFLLECLRDLQFPEESDNSHSDVRTSAAFRDLCGGDFFDVVGFLHHEMIPSLFQKLRHSLCAHSFFHCVGLDGTPQKEVKPGFGDNFMFLVNQIEDKQARKQYMVPNDAGKKLHVLRFCPSGNVILHSDIHFHELRDVVVNETSLLPLLDAKKKGEVVYDAVFGLFKPSLRSVFLAAVEHAASIVGLTDVGKHFGNIEISERAAIDFAKTFLNEASDLHRCLVKTIEVIRDAPPKTWDRKLMSAKSMDRLIRKHVGDLYAAATQIIPLEDFFEASVYGWWARIPGMSGYVFFTTSM